MKKSIVLLLAASLWIGGCSSRTEPGEDAVAGTDLTTGAALDGSGGVIDPGSVTPTEPVELVPAADIKLFSDKPALNTGAGDRVVVTAIVADSFGRSVEGHEVSFSTSGGVLQNVSAITTAAGEATAELSLAGDYLNRNITITASVDDQFAETIVVAAGSVMSMEATEDLILGDTAELVFTLMSGAETPIPNELVEFSSQVGNSFSQNTAITDAAGQVRVSLSTTAGEDVISASALDGTSFSSFDLPVAVNEQAVVQPVRIRVISNESSIKTGGNDVARITTLVTDEDTRVLSGKEVSFSATGGVLQNITSVTNEAGQANAELSLAGDFRNQNIVVSAQADDQSGSVILTAKGSTVSIAGPSSLVSGDLADLEITLTGGNDQPIANEVLSIRSTAGNVIWPANVVTDSNGKANISVSSEAGDDTVIFSALDSTVTATHELNVAADILSIIHQATAYDSLPVDNYSPFAVEWSSNGFPVAGQTMTFSITAGLIRPLGSTAPGASSVDVMTDANGIATIEVSSTSAGPATISFADLLDSDPLSQYDVEFVAIVPSSIALDAAPASVATGNTSTITASVVDIYGNPVQDQVVDFTSPDLRGGSLSPVSALTDADGKAAITLTAGNLPTEIDGVIIEASLANSPSVPLADVKMTVTERQLNVIIGLAGSVVQLDSDTRYSQTGVVQVTDGAGRPVPDATIQMSLRPTLYRYGYMVTVDTDGDDEADSWARFTSSVCDSEDANGNRLLDAGEDHNGNGILDPNDPALIDEDPENTPTVIGSQITTDSSGAGFFRIYYPQSNALWFDVKVTARVEALGTEGVATYETILSIAGADVEDVDKQPPNYISPYGVGPSPNTTGCTQVGVIVP